ncbi:MAG TPA: hypothetical protein VD837_08395 [Terriglobales bacterium]|nr:hypothetical protein [Terriglobales bacterium]
MNIASKSLFVLLGLVIAALCVSAQTPDLRPDAQGSPVPVITFDLVRPGMNPPHWAIAVESTGRAAYRSDPAPENEKIDGDPYIVKFTVSDATSRRIFELAEQTNRFQGNFDYTKSRIADTGTKTLTYTVGHLPSNLAQPVKGQRNQTSYNWSSNPAIQEITSIFQGIATTLEFARRLDFSRRFDKLGLDAELKRMEEMQKAGQLYEVRAVAPTLTNIMNDVSVMHIARERAKRILKAASPS